MCVLRNCYYAESSYCCVSAPVQITLHIILFGAQKHPYKINTSVTLSIL